MSFVSQTSINALFNIFARLKTEIKQMTTKLNILCRDSFCLYADCMHTKPTEHMLSEHMRFALFAAEQIKISTSIAFNLLHEM